jgi:hypothetical protein
VIEADPNAEAFLTPVEWEELGLLDYPSIVKSPMDLSTIKQRLEAGAYDSYEACFADI